MRTTVKRQSPLLAEMIISLLFFAVCACVITCVFVSAFNQSERAASQQEALLYCQNVAEEFKAQAGDAGEYFAALGWEETETGASTQQTFSRTEYLLTAQPVDAGEHIRGFRIAALRDGEECFSFPVEVLTNE